MKIVYFLFASVLLFINCRDECYGDASKKSECTDYQLSDDEKDEGDSCCFEKGKSSMGNIQRCNIFKKIKFLI